MTKPTKALVKSSLSKARRLRSNMTEAERKLWSFLRSNQLRVHFRRQVPVGPYVVDFFCRKAGLIVELDGSQHYLTDRSKHDAKRTSFLEERGYSVLRLNNSEFLKNPRGALQVIVEHLSERLEN